MQIKAEIKEKQYIEDFHLIKAKAEEEVEIKAISPYYNRNCAHIASESTPFM